MGRGLRATEDKAGTVVRRTRWAPAQRVRPQKQWSEEDEAIFLDCLAATCNVEMACEAADVAHTTVYRQRRMRADFAIKWQAALEQGYAALELALVEAASRSLRGDLTREPLIVAPMSAETALRVLQQHRAAVTGQGNRTGYKAPPLTLAEVQDGILRKVEAIQRARAMAQPTEGMADESKADGAGGGRTGDDASGAD